MSLPCTFWRNGWKNLKKFRIIPPDLVIRFHKNVKNDSRNLKKKISDKPERIYSFSLETSNGDLDEKSLFFAFRFHEIIFASLECLDFIWRRNFQYLQKNEISENDYYSVLAILSDVSLGR